MPNAAVLIYQEARTLSEPLCAEVFDFISLFTYRPPTIAGGGRLRCPAGHVGGPFFYGGKLSLTSRLSNAAR